eukprot:Opistho-2@2342
MSEDRSKDFKPKITGDEARRRRQEAATGLRKTKRDESIAKRRRAGEEDDDEIASESEERRTVQLRELAEAMPAVSASLRSEDIQAQLNGARFCRQILSKKNPPTDIVVQAGLVPLLVSCLRKDDYPTIQIEAAWSITNIASGDTECVSEVVRCNAVPELVRLVSNQQKDVREQAVWALGNIAAEGPEFRDFVIGCGTVPALIRAFRESTDLTLTRTAVWALSNLCRGKRPHPDFSKLRESLPILANMIYTADLTILQDACWALSYLGDGPAEQATEQIDAVVSAGVSKRLVELLMYPDAGVTIPALRAVGNILSGNEQQTQVILNCGALPPLVALLNHPRDTIKKEAAWAMSNIAAGETHQIEVLMQSGAVPLLVNIMMQSSVHAASEAMFTVLNLLTGGTPEQVRRIVEERCVNPVCGFLRHTDLKIVVLALKTVEMLLKRGAEEAMRRGMQRENEYARLVEECGGREALETVLQSSQNMEISRLSVKIVSQYYSDATMIDEDASVLPRAAGAAYSFGVSAALPQAGFQF